MPHYQIQATIVRTVAFLQHTGEAAFTKDEDISGNYQQIRHDTLYCEDRSLYLQVSPELMGKIREGLPIRVSPNRCS